MIPTYENNLLESFDATQNTPQGKVYKIDWENNRLLSKSIKDVDAVRQNIEVITAVEYQEHEAMPDWFGLAMKEMYGMPISYVMANMELLIKEALSDYGILKRLYDFEIEQIDDYSLSVTFTVELVDGTTFEQFLEVPLNV